MKLLRYKAKLYWLLRSTTNRLEKHLVSELRKRGFHFSDGKAPDVIWSVTIGSDGWK